MGPQASAHLVKLIVDLSAKEFGAKNGDDFPEIVLISEPIDDLSSDKKKTKKAFRVLKDKIAIFEAAKIKKISIACNAAHLFLLKLQETISIPFVSMIEEVGVNVKNSKLKKIGIMGTPVTLRSGLYSKPLSKSNIRLISPSVSD